MTADATTPRAYAPYRTRASARACATMQSTGVRKAGGALPGGVHHRSTTREAATKGPLTVARARGGRPPLVRVEAQLVTDGLSDLLAR